MKHLIKATAVALLAIIGLTTVANAAELPEGFAPCGANSLVGTWIKNGNQNDVQLTFNAPTQATKYDITVNKDVFVDLEEISFVEILRSEYNQYAYRKVATIDNVSPGQELSYTDKGLNNGRWDYRILIHSGNSVSSDWDWNSMTTVAVGQVPADFEEDDVYAIPGEGMLTLYIKAPALSTAGEPITMPMSLKVSKVVNSSITSFTAYKTLNNVTPGEVYTLEIPNLANGAYSYAVEAITETGMNHMGYANTYVGTDLPGEAIKPSATVCEGGVLVSWSAPRHGQNGGNMGNVDDLTYTVRRKLNVADGGKVVAEDIKELSFVDNIDASKEAMYIYSIVAKNSQGSGNEAYSNLVIVGPASTLPYKEGFDTKDTYGGYGFDNSVWTKDYSGYYCTWYTADQIMVNTTNIKPHTGGGLAYAMYTNWRVLNQWDAITTGSINFEKADNPELTLWLYDFAVGGSDLTLQIQTSIDGVEFTTVESIEMGKAETEGWRQISADLSNLKGQQRARVRICTVASGDNLFCVVIDDLTILEKEAGSDAICNTYVNVNNDATYNIQGQRINANSHKGIVIKNGKKYLTR